MEVDFNVAFSKIITDSAKIEKMKELPMEEYVHFCHNLFNRL